MTVRQRSALVSPQRQEQPANRSPTDAGEGTSETSFADHLEGAQQESESVELSAHAKRRLMQRDISLDDAERNALAEAVEQLDGKGAREAAVLRDDAAFVVNVPSRTVITAMDQTEMKERVFTQIDSAMML